MFALRPEALVFIGSLLVLAAILSVRLSRRWGAPVMLFFVGIGMLAGVDGPGGIAFADYDLAYNVGLLALAAIVFAGGFETEAREFKAALGPAALLASLGVVIKAGVVGATLALAGFLEWPAALLVGAILAPTDAAAVFNVLKGQGLRPRLTGILEAESGTNDPVSIYLTTALTAFAVTGTVDTGSVVLGMVAQLTVGAVLGVIGGKSLPLIVRKLPPADSPGLYPILALAGGLGIYAFATLVGGNGFLAVFIAGLMFGRGRVPFRTNISHLLDSAAWLSQIVVFLMLGLLSFPSQLPEILPIAALTSAVVLAARPLAVFAALLPFQLVGARFDRAELALLSWGGLKGAVPIILALFPLLQGLPAGQTIFNVVFVVVLISTTVQGTTLIPLAARTGLLEPQPPRPLVEIDLHGAMPDGGHIVGYALDHDDWCMGRPLSELGFPDDVAVVAIARGTSVVAARGSTIPRGGDHVFVFVPDGRSVEEVRSMLSNAPESASSPARDERST